MSMREDARRNLELAGLFDKDSDYDGMLGEAVMKLVNTHLDEGHSGMSHVYTLHLFNKVIKGHALTAKFWDERRKSLEEFAMREMGEPWKPEILEEMLGPRPKESKP